MIPAISRINSNVSRAASIARMFERNRHAWDVALKNRQKNYSSTLASQASNNTPIAYSLLPIQAKSFASSADERRYIIPKNLTKADNTASKEDITRKLQNFSDGNSPLDISKSSPDTSKKVIEAQQFNLQKFLFSQLGLGHLVNSNRIKLGYYF